MEHLVQPRRRMVRLSVAFRGSPRRDKNLVEALRFLMMGTRLEPGCLGCSAWSDPDETLHYQEEWATEADMRRRVRSERFTSLLGVLESTSEPPRVQFAFVSTTRGLDYVAEVRGSGQDAGDGLNVASDGRTTAWHS
jgi:quinol monooxygenase YgiN